MSRMCERRTAFCEESVEGGGRRRVEEKEEQEGKKEKEKGE